MTLPIVTRTEAIAAGLKHYFTGKRCKNGHVAERFVCNSRCVECDRRHYISSARTAAWRAANPQKNREIKRNSQRRRRAANSEKVREIDRNSSRKYRAKKLCKEVSARIDCGLERAKASGSLLDIDTAIDIFKAQDNAFEFLETS